jgi:hypothetical protein
MSISAAEATKIDKAFPVSQSVGVGAEAKAMQDKAAYDPIFIKVEITADATAGQSVTIPYAFELMEVIVQARDTVENGTVTVRKGTDAITNAIIMAADTVITRAGTITDAQSTILTTDDINVITANAGDVGLVILSGYRA